MFRPSVFFTYPDHSYGYTYKQNGDIEAVTYTTQNGAYTSFYHYDDLRRLVREDNGYNQKTYTYEYDTSGNILNRKEYSYTEPTAQVGTPTSTDTYTYGDSTWKDLLTSYNGESMVYDALGNPTTYRGNAMEWDNVTRKLISMQTDDWEISLHYDESGRRRVKNLYDGIDTSKVHFYYYDGSTLLYETIGTIVEVEDGTEIVEELIQYVVDETGSQIGFIHNGTEYYFAKNLQGDVQRIYTANGALVGEYHYDAWGNHTIVTDINGIATLNPFRYRGYYYDSETGLYYLNSRYYDPETGRFISADSIVPGVSSSVDGYNLFAYCFNNPVNMIDEDGDWPSWFDFLDFAKETVDYLVQGTLESITIIPGCSNLSSPFTIIKELHYARNIFNNTSYTESELINKGYEHEPPSSDKFHQNNQLDGKRNRKYVIGEWFSSEMVYYHDGTINDTPEDRGTFNTYSGDNAFLNVVVHGVCDVVPYIIWGNSSDDTTTIIDRIVRCVK